MEFDTNLVVIIILRINEGLAFDLAIQEKEACEVLEKIPWTVKVCGQSIAVLFSPLSFRMFIMLWDFCFYKNNEMNYDCEQYCNSGAKFFNILYHVQGYVKKKLLSYGTFPVPWCVVLWDWKSSRFIPWGVLSDWKKL